MAIGARQRRKSYQRWKEYMTQVLVSERNEVVFTALTLVGLPSLSEKVDKVTVQFACKVNGDTQVDQRYWKRTIISS